MESDAPCGFADGCWHLGVAAHWQIRMGKWTREAMSHSKGFPLFPDAIWLSTNLASSIATFLSGALSCPPRHALVEEFD